ncbi:MAG: ribonuclease HI family protein [Candidatus Pacebacteria bacterium]|nr:ribonuclease HI family protein [Candidatus Paceibacterota bacterium]
MKKITIYTDGGSRNNPGSGAIGVVFCNEKGQSFKKYSEFLGEKITNNEAEYRAVIFALEKFKALFGKKIATQSEVRIKSDSELLVKQLNGIFKVSDDNIQSLFIKVWNLKIDFKKVKFSLIPRSKNKEADDLVNEVLDTQDKGQPLPL